MGHRSKCPNVDLGNGLLLVIADSAKNIAGAFDEAHFRNRCFVRTRLFSHIVDLGDLTFRLLPRGIKF